MLKLLLFCCLFTVISGQAQLLDTRTSEILDISAIKGTSFSGKRSAEISGSPLLSENWGKGTVKFSNGRLFRDVSLQFNLYTNQLHYQLEGMVFAFLDPIKEFVFTYEETGENRTVLFRNGYPSQGVSNEWTFYEVLMQGSRFQLLKHNYKTVRDFKDYSSTTARSYHFVSELFIYDKQTKSLKSIKPNTILATVLPDQADAIATISSNKNYKFHSEKELSELLAKL
jgi:hypothetical protein